MSNFKRDEFDFKCWRCEHWVNISDCLYIPVIDTRWFGWSKHMCYECIVEIAEFIRK